MTPSERLMCLRHACTASVDKVDDPQIPEAAPGGIVGGRFRSLQHAEMLGFPDAKKFEVAVSQRHDTCFIGYTPDTLFSSR